MRRQINRSLFSFSDRCQGRCFLMNHLILFSEQPFRLEDYYSSVFISGEVDLSESLNNFFSNAEHKYLQSRSDTRK